MEFDTCNACKENGWGEWYYSDHGNYQFFLCYGDCQDRDNEIDLAIWKAMQ